MDGRYPEGGEQSRVNGEAPWRLSYGENVAPLAQQMPQQDGSSQRNPNVNGNGSTPWRAGYGEVAPAAQNFPSQTGNPNVNGNGNTPWRATPGVAPGFPSENPNPPQQTQPGNGNVPDWGDYARRQVGGGQNGANPFPTDRAPAQPGAGHVPDEQRRIIGDSLNLKTSVLGYLWTGGLTGAGMHAGMYAADAKLLATPLDQRTGFLKWWEQYSPAQKLLSEQTAALQTAKDAFSSATAARTLAQTQLDGVKLIPESLLTGSEAALAKAGGNPALMSRLQGQKVFLEGLGGVSSADDIIGVIGKKSQLGKEVVHNGVSRTVLFDEASKLGGELKLYATGLSTGTAGDAAALAGKHISTLEKRLATMGAGQTERIVLQSQIDFLKGSGYANLEQVKAVIGTADEVAAGSKLWVQGTKEANDLLSYATKAGANADAAATLANAEKGLAIKSANLETAMAKGPGAAHGSLLETSVKGLAKGIGVSALSLGAGYALDSGLSKVFGYGAPASDGKMRFLMDGVAVPAILLSGMQPRYKYPMAAMTFLGARAGDYFAGTGASADMSMLLRPNTIDAVGITASALAPIPGKYKAIGIAGTIAIGRGWNLLARATGLDGGSPAQLDTDTKSLVTRDITARTESSFERAANKAKELGIENHAALELQLIDSLNQTSAHPMDYNRQIAALSFGLGQARLESGSRLDPTNHGQDAYFLKDKNYDLGGLSTIELRRAAGSLVAAQQWARSHKGENVNGQVMDDEYIKQLENLQKKVEGKLDVIYGEHKNFESAVYNEIKERCRTNLQETMKYIVSQNQLLNSLRTSDKRYVAKMARDAALVNMAYADYISGQNNGEDAKAFMQAAVNYLAQAEQMEGGSADLKELKRIADRVKLRVPVAQNNQWNNNFNNPFQLNR